MANCEFNQKQAVRQAFDEMIIDVARKREGLTNCEVLHPSLMYQLFWPIFQGRLPVKDLATHVRYERLPRLDLPKDLAVSCQRAMSLCASISALRFPILKPIGAFSAK